MDKIVFLHGFMGSPEDFSFLEEKLKDRYQCVSLQLPLDMMRLNIVSIANHISKQLDQLKIDKAHFWGYSMGGRILLELYRQRPLLFKTLTLESTSPGIRDPAERKKRLESDRIWAGRLQENSSKFIDRWYQQDLFKNFIKIPTFEEIKGRRLKKLSPKFAKLIVDASPGANADFHDIFAQMQTPSLVLVGEYDVSYVQSLNLVDKSQQIDVKTLPDCGHVIHLERPELALEEFFNFQKRTQKNREANYE